MRKLLYILLFIPILNNAQYNTVVDFGKSGDTYLRNKLLTAEDYKFYSYKDDSLRDNILLPLEYLQNDFWYNNVHYKKDLINAIFKEEDLCEIGFMGDSYTEKYAKRLKEWIADNYGYVGGFETFHAENYTNYNHLYISLRGCLLYSDRTDPYIMTNRYAGCSDISDSIVLTARRFNGIKIAYKQTSGGGEFSVRVNDETPTVFDTDGADSLAWANVMFDNSIYTHENDTIYIKRVSDSVTLIGHDVYYENANEQNSVKVTIMQDGGSNYPDFVTNKNTQAANNFYDTLNLSMMFMSFLDSKTGDNAYNAMQQTIDSLNVWTDTTMNLCHLTPHDERADIYNNQYEQYFKSAKDNNIGVINVSNKIGSLEDLFKYELMTDSVHLVDDGFYMPMLVLQDYLFPKTNKNKTLEDAITQAKEDVLDTINDSDKVIRWNDSTDAYNNVGLSRGLYNFWNVNSLDGASEPDPRYTFMNGYDLARSATVMNYAFISGLHALQNATSINGSYSNGYKNFESVTGNFNYSFANGYNCGNAATGNVYNSFLTGRQVAEDASSLTDFFGAGEYVFEGNTGNLAECIGIGKQAGRNSTRTRVTLFGNYAQPTANYQMVLGSEYYTGGILLDTATSINGNLDVDIVITGTGIISDNDDTPDVSGATTWTYNGTANSVTITDLDNPVVGAEYRIIGNSDTYTVTINDSGNFNLEANVTLGEDDNILIRCIADNNYIQVGKLIDN